MPAVGQANVDLLDPSTIIDLHDDLIFSEGRCPLEGFSEVEERLYERVSTLVEDAEKLSAYIPSPPNQLMLLLKELEDENTNFTKIQDIIKQDLGLLSEIVRISNSPLYLTRAREITSIEKAISLLGMRGVMEITSQLMLRRVLDVRSPRFKNFSDLIWSHCLKAAEAACKIGDSDQAFVNYLLGLIHSIGRVVILSAYVDFIGDSEEDINDVKLIKHISLEQGPWLTTLVAKEWGLSELYLETLEEYEGLCGSMICQPDFEFKLDTTRTLYLGSTCAQVHTLIGNDKIDQEAGLQFLENIGVSTETASKIFEQFDKLDSAEV